MTDTLQNLKNTGSAAARKTWTLTEVVGIMALINEGKSKKDIAQLTGRSVHSLQYKFFEGEIKGKEEGTRTVRSVKQYATMEALYAAHKTTYSAEDLAKRVADFQATLNQNQAAV